MGFVDAIKSFYRRYFDFESRSSRSEYWWVQLFMILVAILFIILFAITGGDLETFEGSALSNIVLILGALFVLVSIIPGIAVSVRRFHDQDKSGWFYLLNFIPYIGGIIVLVFMCIGGTAGTNRFGADPLGRDTGVFD